MAVTETRPNPGRPARQLGAWRWTSSAPGLVGGQVVGRRPGLWSRLTGAGNGLGSGYNSNAILPIYPSPLVGMQGWYDTTCTARRV